MSVLWSHEYKIYLPNHYPSPSMGNRPSSGSWPPSPFQGPTFGTRFPVGHWSKFGFGLVTMRLFPFPTIPAVVSTGPLVPRRDPGSSLTVWLSICSSWAVAPAPRGGWSPSRDRTSVQSSIRDFSSSNLSTVMNIKIRTSIFYADLLNASRNSNVRKQSKNMISIRMVIW